MIDIFKNWVFGNERAWKIYTIISFSNGLNVNQISKLADLEFRVAQRLILRMEKEGLIMKQGAENVNPNVNSYVNPNINPFLGINQGSRAKASIETSTQTSIDSSTPKTSVAGNVNQNVNTNSGVHGGSRDKTSIETSILFNDSPSSLDNSINNKTKKKKEREKWRDRNLQDLDFTGKVFHIYDKINATETEKNYGEVREIAGNWAKAGSQIKLHERKGFKNLREIEASIRFWFKQSGKWEDGHFIDRWAAQIPAMIDGAKREGLLKTHRRTVDPTAVHDRDAKRLKEMGMDETD